MNTISKKFSLLKNKKDRPSSLPFHFFLQNLNGREKQLGDRREKKQRKTFFFPFPFSLWQQVSLFIRGYLNGKPFLLRGEKELRENAILVKLKILFFHLISVFSD
jgi:hypothetical protein